MEEKLVIIREDMNEIRFDRVHRLPTRHNSQTRTKPRPVIAKFSFYQDKEYVMSKVKKLKDTGVGISHDYPKEIDVIHEKLYPRLNKGNSLLFSKWINKSLTDKYIGVWRPKNFLTMDLL